MIKRVTKEDFDLISECDNLLYELIIEDSKYDDNYKTDIKLNSIKKDLNDVNNYLYVYLENNSVIGFIYGQINDSKRYNNKVGRIVFLYVMKEYRNNKIGTKLVNQLKKDFAKEGIKYIDVSVFYKNEISNYLYKKLGFNNYISNLRCEIK